MRLINADVLRRSLIMWRETLDEIIEREKETGDCRRYAGRRDAVKKILHDIKEMPDYYVSGEQKSGNGKWIYTCSICGAMYERISNFCPNCGANMGEEREDEAD